MSNGRVNSACPGLTVFETRGLSKIEIARPPTVFPGKARILTECRIVNSLRPHRSFDMVTKCTGCVNFFVSCRISVPLSTNPNLR